VQNAKPVHLVPTLTNYLPKTNLKIKCPCVDVDLWEKAIETVRFSETVVATYKFTLALQVGRPPLTFIPTITLNFTNVSALVGLSKDCFPNGSLAKILYAFLSLCLTQFTALSCSLSCRWSDTISLNCGHQGAYFSSPRNLDDIGVWIAPVEWYWQREIEELGAKPVSVPLCPPQLRHGLRWEAGDQQVRNSTSLFSDCDDLNTHCT
jgi:hypothetical protein